MKRFRWTWVAAAAVVALGFFTVFDGKRLEKEEQEAEGQKSLVKLPIENLTHIEVKTRTYKTVFDKDPAKPPEVAWKVVAPFQDEADFLAIESLLNQAEAEKSMKTVAEGDQLDLKAFGLDDPVTQLKLVAKDGSSMGLSIGSIRAYDGNLYAKLAGEKRVLLVSSAWDGLLSKLPKDFRNKRPLRNTDLKLADLKRLVFRPAGGTAFEVIRDGEKWRIKGAPDFAIDNEKVSAFFERIKDFRVRDFLEDQAAVKAKAQLAKGPSQVALYKETDAKARPAFSMSFVADPASKTEEYLGLSSDLTIPVAMTRNALEVFDKTPQDFFDRKLPFHFAAGDVARVEVASADLKASFEKKGETWSLSGPESRSQLRRKADSAKLNELVKRLSQMEAFRILPAKAQEKFDSRMILRKTDGSPVFELAWGALEIEKASGHRPEARPETRYVRASAKISAEYRVGLAEGDIKSLGLGSLVSEEPKEEAKPAQKPAPKNVIGGEPK